VICDRDLDHENVTDEHSARECEADSVGQAMAEYDVAQGEGESSDGERMYVSAFRVRIAHPPPSAILIAVMADARKFMETVKAEEEAEQAGETEKQYALHSAGNWPADRLASWSGVRSGWRKRRERGSGTRERASTFT
jgi:hypothetical protein